MKHVPSVTFAALLVLAGTGAAAAQDQSWYDGSQVPEWRQESGGYRDGGDPSPSWSRMAQSDYDRGYEDAYRRFRGNEGYGSREMQDRWNPGARSDRYRFGDRRDWADRGGHSTFSGQAADDQSGMAGRRSASNGDQGGPSEDQAGSRQSVASARGGQDLADIRRQLSEAGFRQIRILDTTYLVQATTSNGRSVVMIVDPPRDGSAGQALSRSDDRGTQSSSRSASAEATGSGDQPIRSEILPGLTQNAVRSKLQDRGFGQISALHRDGSTFVGTGEWYGDQVDFRVDGRNGYIIEPSHITPRQIRTKLDRDGWTDLADLRDAGANYRVTASRNGSTYDLLIDARTGQITSRIAMNGSDADQQTTGTLGNNQSAPGLAHETIPGQSKTSKILNGTGQSGEDEGGKSGQ